MHTLTSPLIGTVVRICVAVGQEVSADDEVAVLESMKMEHPLVAGVDGTISAIHVDAGDTVAHAQVLLSIAPGTVDATTPRVVAITESTERADLARYNVRRSFTTDASRPQAVERRSKKGQRTARVNIADLVDDGSFIEYGSFAVAAQRQRRELQDLIENTPADGLVGGLATINADEFGEDAARCAVVSYDYTVLAGTQGFLNHRKKDRLFTIAHDLQLPVVLFAEGGGGRPGDTDSPGVAGLDTMAFALFAQLSGLSPTIGIASGYCFAGNAALLGCCDVIIATENTNIGMAGPAMIEGGGLGKVLPTDIGTIEVQTKNGVVDVRVADEQEAVAVAKNYDVRAVINTLADIDSVLELRSTFGIGILTALIRIEGKPMGVIANNPAHLGGAIDADAADKAARFMQLCDAYDVPLLSLCDTPGFMVGPAAEESAQVRHFSRMFVTAASTTIPWITVVLRKGYGLGAQAMAGGSFHAKIATLSWPTGEFGGMGLEGAVRLGFRKELEAIVDPHERQALEDKLIASAYERGDALNMASHVEIDDVIDPSDTRLRILGILRSCPTPPRRVGKKRPMIDTW